MTLEQAAQIASIVASLAVVISLVFISRQLKQNTDLTRMQTAQNSAELLSMNYGRVVESAELAELLTRGSDISQYSDAELLRVRNFFAAMFRYYEVLHTHQRFGNFEEELWKGAEARLRDSMSSLPIRRLWALNRKTYAPTFAAFVDQVCAELEAEGVVENPSDIDMFRAASDQEDPET